MMRRWVLYLALLTFAAGSFYWALGLGAPPPHRRADPPAPSAERPRWDVNRQLDLQKVIRGEPAPAARDRTAPISGVILDSITGRPVAGADVELYAGETSLDDAETGEDGTFSLAPQQEGTEGPLELEIVADGYAARTATPKPVIYLDPLGRIAGRVVDAQGRPVAGVSIHTLADPEIGDNDDSVTEDAETGERGEFEVAELEPGEYLVYVRNDDDDSKLDARAVRVRPGQTARLELAMRKRSTLELRGRVVDRRGNPLAFVTVAARASGPTSALNRALLAEAEDTDTGVDGEFYVRVASTGWYELELRSDLEGKTLARARLFAAKDAQEATVVVSQEPVACSLRDAQGRTVPFSGYSFFTETASGGLGGIGGGSSGSLGSTLHFLWPEKATGIRVGLNGRGLEGSVHLAGPGDPCVIQGSAPGSTGT
jgi:hypothetical protein